MSKPKRPSDLMDLGIVINVKTENFMQKADLDIVGEMTRQQALVLLAEATRWVEESPLFDKYDDLPT